MCGIVGFYHPNGICQTESKSIIHEMSSALRHRGPDAFGSWLDQKSGIALYAAFPLLI